MPMSSTCKPRSDDRLDRVRRVVGEVAGQRASGEDLSDEIVLSRYPDLLPELSDELRKLREIDVALAEAESERHLQVDRKSTRLNSSH